MRGTARLAWPGPAVRGKARLGMAGVALGQVVASAAGAVFLLVYLRSGRSRVGLPLGSVAVDRTTVLEVLKTGATAAVSPVMSITSIIILNRLVAGFGPTVLAGFGIGNTHFNAGQRKAHRAGPTVTIMRIGGDDARFGHAITLEDRLPRPLAKCTMGFGRERRRSRNEQADRGGQARIKARIAQQARVKGRHPHHRRRLRQQADHHIKVELGHEDHC
jgi:hypothetical protein